ncbi:unnamed protein product [Albugo candida]|uniref:Mediator of RNA polymerase II transcription subunit 7 n=1 Tax=Albugo candida TaxID=65357 RepID=A0A024GGG9_9STRA|nr:unnamed protein product [Albugo candida]|eukprot:CCI45962.1 unnamed protein product [Albugo candida]
MSPYLHIIINVIFTLKYKPLLIAMTDEETSAGPEIVSEFPPPPAFFSLYQVNNADAPLPPAPMAPNYHMFGTPYSTKDIVPDLLPDDSKKLYLPTLSTQDPKEQSIDYKAQLKKLNRSLLANCIQLLDVLIRNPKLFNEKVDDLELLFVNMHNLINKFRPHQAREHIILMLQSQIEEKQAAISDFRRVLEESREQVERAHSALDFDTQPATICADVSIKEEVQEMEQIKVEPQHLPCTETTRTEPIDSKMRTLNVIQQRQDQFFKNLQCLIAK